MDELIRREHPGLVARAEGDERIIEGIVVPWARTSEPVRDRPDGPVYREAIMRGSIDLSDPARFILEGPPVPGTPSGRHAGHLIGRSTFVEDRQDGLFARFRVASTSHALDTYELARAGVLTDFSVEFLPVAHRRAASGVIERTAIDLRRVAILDAGAYPGAVVSAVRAATQEGDMSQDQDQAPGAAQNPPAPPAPAPVAPAPATAGNEAQRAAAERDTVASLARSSGGPAYLSRPELVYGPAQRGAAFLRDVIHRGSDPDAADRQRRHYAMLYDIIGRAAMVDDDGRPVIDWSRIERAGDVLTTELGGAIPTEFLPGLLVPRLIKGRPMASFYRSFGVADARPRTFPKVTTSTSAAAQAQEGANPPASDFATTAESKTPALVGASTLASRQALDSGDPSTEIMIMEDMREAYAQASETAVKVAVEAGATANSVTVNDTAPFFGTVDQVVEFQTARFTPAEACFMPSALYAALLKEPDGVTGRLQVPFYGPQNTDGRADAGGAGAYVLDVPHRLSWASTVNVSVIGQPADYVIYESAIAEFRIENDSTVTPANILLGLWAYLAIGTRRGSRKSTAS